MGTSRGHVALPSGGSPCAFPSPCRVPLKIEVRFALANWSTLPSSDWCLSSWLRRRPALLAMLRIVRMSASAIVSPSSSSLGAAATATDFDRRMLSRDAPRDPVVPGVRLRSLLPARRCC